MEDRSQKLQAEYEQSLWQTARLKVQFDLACGLVLPEGVPHYQLIEQAAHDIGQQLARATQQLHMNELAARLPDSADCPTCQKHCSLVPFKRTVTSGDGPVEIQELKAHCPRCRRDFFPSSDPAGTG